MSKLLPEINNIAFRMDADIKKSIKYTKGFIDKSKSASNLRSYSTERNNEWKKESKKFLLENAPKTREGKINNKYYRYKFKYDVIVPAVIYNEVIDYYIYSLENNIIEDYEFIEQYMDHLMMFSQALFYYKDRYKSYLESKRSKTPLYVRLLYNMIGRDYRRIVSFLQKLGLIDVDEMYVPKWRDYKSDKHRKGICKHYGFDVELGNESYVYQINNRGIVSKAYVSDTRITGEADYAKTPSNITKDDNLNKYMSDNFDFSKKFSENRHEDYDGYTYYYSRVCEDGQKLKDFKIGRDSFGHRFYHPFLNMKSKVRDFIEIGGSTNNVTVDIANCHPYLFSMLFDDNFLKSVSSLLVPEEIELFKSVAKEPAFKDKIYLLKKITSAGRYYDFLRENIKQSSNSLTVKELNMIYFYGNYNKRNAVYKFFNENFDFINLVKYRLIKIGGHKRLCQILQRVESKIMIDGVFFSLIKDGYKALPLHDAFMVPKNDAILVRKRIHDTLKKMKVEFMPSFNKRGDINKINEIFDQIKFEGGQKFISSVLLFENLNFIIKSVGINNRVFKDDMKSESISYIDQRFENMREDIDDDLANQYYDLRIKMDMGETVNFDYSEMFQEYKKTYMKKRKYYAKDVIDYVKINPVEFMNYKYGTNYKTRVKENKYVY